MPKYVLKLVLFALLTTTIAACGGAPALPTATSAALPATSATPPTGVSAGAPTTLPPTAVATTSPATASAATALPTTPPAAANTPNNVVPTVDPKAANTTFQSAKALGTAPLKVSFKDSEFYYKLDVARGGIISATLAVDAFSPQPANLTLYDEKQGYLNDVTVPVGKSAQLRHIFGSKGGGTVYLTLKGNSSVTLTGQALAQNDGATKADAADDLDTAVLVPLGSLNGLLGDDDKEDDYVVDLAKTGGVLNTSIRTTDGNVKLTVYDDSRNYVADVSADKNHTDPVQLQHILASGQGGHWYLSVSGSGTYALNAAFGAQNDGGSGKDAPGDFDTALSQKLGNFSGLVGGPDNEDYYRFDLGKGGGTFTLTVATSDGSVKATVYSEPGVYVSDISTDKSKTTPATFRYVLNSTQGGNWFVVLSGEGSYTANTAFVSQNDGGTGADAGDSSDTAASPKSASFTGTLGDADTTDYFKIPAAMGRKINVQYPKGSSALKIALYDKDDNYLKDTSLNQGESVDLVEDSGLTSDYFIVISGGNGNYAVKVSP